MRKIIELKIDPEFRDILPSSEEGYKKLEKAVLEDGRFTDPFITWNGYIIDGHTRYRIMQNHPEIDLNPYEKKMDDILADRAKVIAWIAMHQESRRNINDYQWAEIHKKAYEAQKKSEGGQVGHVYYGNQHGASLLDEIGKSPTNGKSRTTASSLAKDFGMAEGQFRHSVNIANAMDEAEKLVPGAKEKIKGGDIKVKKSAVEDILRIKDEDERKNYIESIIKGEKPKSPNKESHHKSKEMINFSKNMMNAVAEMETIKEFTLDDAIGDLNSAEDVFLTQVRFVLRNKADIIRADERGYEPVIGFIESAIHDLEILKGEIANG